MKLKLSQKFILMIFGIVFLLISGVMLVSILKSSSSLVSLAKTDLAHLASMGKNACELAAQNSQNKVKSDLQLARLLFEDYSGGTAVMENGKIILNPDSKRYVVNDNHKFVDEIQKLTGSDCSIVMKQGATGKRVQTTVVDENGNRALGSYVSQEVYDAVLTRGESYVGRTQAGSKRFVTAYWPIRNPQNEILGAILVGVNERSEALREGLLAQQIGETGYIYAIDTKGVLQIHPAKEGVDISKYDFIQEMTARAPSLGANEIGWIEYPWINKELGETKARNKIVAYTYFPQWDWVIAAGSYLDEFTAPVNGLRNALLFLGVVFLLFSLGAAFMIARSISKPIGEIVEVAEAVAVGDVTKTVNIQRQDEIGTLADSFRNMTLYLQENAELAEKIAQNDIRVSVEPKSENDVLGHSFKAMVENLTSIIVQLTDSSNELVSAANEIASSSEQMSRGAKDQSERVSQVSVAIEEMTASVVEAAKNAGEANNASQGASDRATSGGQVVSETISGMQKISDVVRQSSESIGKLADAAQQIGDIVGVINDIADQTNLLALNAAIEAARAGEQGRGFAVVADEVRKLADRTGNATKEIENMIKGIQQGTGEAVSSMESGIEQVDKGRDLADKAGTSLSEIVSMSQTVMEMIQQIAAASEEQSAASEQISRSIDGILSVTKETANGAEQSAAAAEELSAQAEGLKNIVAKFKV